MRTLFAAALVMAAFFMPVAQAQKMPPCGKTDEVMALLNEEGYRTVGRGLVDETTVFAVLKNRDGRWIGLVTKAQGVSCLVLSGEALELAPLGSSS